MKLGKKAYSTLNLLMWKIFGDNVKLSYARGGLDLVLQEIFGNKTNGSYLDIGCYDPIYDSNTFRLYQKGWHGVVVDPNSRFRSRFEAYRPKDIFLNNIVSSSNEELTYYSFQEPGYDQANTISSEAKDLAMNRFGLKEPLENKIKSISLGNIFGKYIDKEKGLDLLCIDAEGAEMEILSSADWGWCFPKVIVLEVGYTLENLNQEEPVNFLKSKGYIINSYITLDKTKGNVFLVHKESGLI